MRWTVRTGDVSAVVAWRDGELTGSAWLVDDVERFAAQHAGELLAPIPCTSIAAGLRDPLAAWATVTLALSEHRDQGAVRTPRPPVPLGPRSRSVVF